MPTKKKGAFLILLFLWLVLFSSPQELPEHWKKWLEEVDPIITKAERSVYKTLQTEEDRKRFQRLFWQARDTTPGTPENEFMTDYYNRHRYAMNRLEGAHSDRGRIYLLLGKPAEVQNFTGSDQVVDCELWIYRGEGRPGLPPMMYLLFFRRDNMGEYKLYYPGFNSSLDILSMNSRGGGLSRARAYKTIRRQYPELAKATLSVIPEEANVDFAGTPNSSGQVIGQIYSLPEREAERNYLKNFSMPAGAVEVSYSTQEIPGTALLFLTERAGIKFLNYSLMPDRIQTAFSKEGFETAHLAFHLLVEDQAGKTIYQQEKEIRLRLDQEKKRALSERKVIFNDFAPLIEGEFQITLTYTNKTSQEFFVHQQKMIVDDRSLPLVVGYTVKEKKPDTLPPFSLENFKVLLDPRSVFSRNDTLEGLISAPEIPDIFLSDREEENSFTKIQEVSQQGRLVFFKHPLSGLKPGYYDLVIRERDAEVFRWSFSVLSFALEKPLEFERVEELSFLEDLPFIIGQEYLNNGRVDEALESFQQLSETHWNSVTLPVMARAYYLKEDYARVLDLLERNAVEKNYQVLLLLGNASLKLRKLEQAAFYFEEVRKFGDTAETNEALGAIYYSLGDQDKAQVYWERAKKLHRETEERNQKKE